jgi:ABC-type sugar transport system ATPase subunit
VGVRPEHLAIDGDGADLPATVVLVEALGHERLVICELDDGRRVVARIHHDGVQEGDEVKLGAQPGRRHRFDATSGERIAS